MELRELGPDDGGALASFTCNTSGEGWTLAAQFMINESLQYAIEHNDAKGIALWDKDRLAAVAAWTVDAFDPSIWRCTTVAVQNGYKRHGLAERLKREVLDQARAAGAHRVESTVHRENDAMVAVNIKLGAKIAPDPESFDYLLCVIAL